MRAAIIEHYNLFCSNTIFTTARDRNEPAHPFPTHFTISPKPHNTHTTQSRTL